TNYTSKDKGGILSHYNIHGILPVGNKVWIGTFDHGLDVLDIGQNKIVAHYNMGGRSTLRNNFIFSLYKTRANNIIVISTAAIQSYNPQTDNFDLVGTFPEHIHYTCF